VTDDPLAEPVRPPGRVYTGPVCPTHGQMIKTQDACCPRGRCSPELWACPGLDGIVPDADDNCPYAVAISSGWTIRPKT
jgi:hypothetical protein